MKSSTNWDVLRATSLDTSSNPLRCTINCAALTESEMTLLFRFVNSTISRSAVVLEPTDWLERNLVLALALSLAPSEKHSALTKNC